MKHVKMLLLFYLFVTVTVSCKNSDVEPQSNTTVITPPVNSISLKLGGVLRTSNAPLALYSKTGGLLQISSLFNSGESVTLIVKNAAVGTFSVSAGEASANYSLDINSSNIYTGATGTITIATFNSTTISGAFHFSGANSKNETGEITDGLFLVNIIVQ
jgi:hypothetical protein